MKVKRFKIGIYGWRCVVMEVVSSKDWKVADKEMRVFKCKKSDRKLVVANIKNEVGNGGEHFYNTTSRRTLIILYRITSRKKRMEILAHEKRHMEDRMMNHLGIDNIEAVGYLAGYLAKKMF